MRILVYGIFFSPEPIGIGRFTGDMAFHLVNEGFDVDVITALPFYPSWKIWDGYSIWQYYRETVKNVNVIRCPLWVPRQPSGFNRLLHLLSFAVSSLPVVIWYALQSKPDVIICVVPTLFSAPLALLASWLSKAKGWLHIQDFELDTAFNLGMLPGRKFIYPLVEWAEQSIFKSFDRVSTISANMRLLCIEKGVKAEDAFLLPNWVDTRRIYPLPHPSSMRNELDIPDQTFIALYHGNMGRKQGLELLLETALLLLPRAGILFILCGEGPAKKELVKNAASLPNILFLDLQPEERLNDLVNLADIHLLPQLANVADLVMPSKLCTMLASGKPAIAGVNPGTQIAQMLDKIGVVVQPGNASALADAILDLFQNPTKRTHLGDLSRSYACQNLDRQMILTELKTTLTTLRK